MYIRISLKIHTPILVLKTAPSGRIAGTKVVTVPISLSSVDAAFKAVCWLYACQKERGEVTSPSPRDTMAVSKLVRGYSDRLRYDNIQIGDDRAAGCVVRD